MRIDKLLMSIALSAIISLSSTSPAYADDTDIYLSTADNSSTTDIQPKIMVIIDSSGSMGTVDVDSPDAYDPATDYQALGGTWDSKLVYWTTGGRPTDTATTQKISRSNFVCEQGQAALDGTPGYTTNHTAFGWYPNPSDVSIGHWYPLPDLQGIDTAWDNYVDCKADQNAGKADSTSKYFHRSYATSDGSFGGAYTNAYGNRATSTSFWSLFNSNSISFYSGNYLNWYQLKGSTYTGKISRMQAAQNAVNAIITATHGVELGLMTYNTNSGTSDGGARVIMNVTKLNSTTRANLQTVTNSITDNGWTPLAESLYEAYLYFAGKAPTTGGRTAIDNGAPAPYSDYCAQDSASTSCAPYSADPSANWPASGSTQPNYVSPLEQQCEKAYVVIVTDGAPTRDSDLDTSTIDPLTGKTIYSTTSVPGDTWNGSTSYNSDDRLDDLAGWLNNHDINDGLTGDQSMVTFTVGFDPGSGIGAAGEELLKRTAGVGGGQYLTATNTDTLSDTLQAVIYSITSTTSSFSAPSLSVNAFNKLYNRDEIYFSLFEPALYKRWSGNIKKFTLCTQVQADASKCEYGEIIDRNENPAIDITTSRIKDSSVSYWNTVTDGGDVEIGGAGKAMYDDGYANRNITTWTGAYTGLSEASPATPIDVKMNTTTATPFQTTVEADPTLLGMSSTATATEVQDMIEWIRGKDSYDEDNDATTTQRWVFSDPLHSRPLAITFGAKEVTAGVYDYDSPIIKLLVAGNDGVIRLIDENSGKEQWSFIPKEVLQDSQTLATNGVGSHVYGVDSTPVVYVIDNNQNGILEPTDSDGNHDKMYAYIGMRRGSKNGSNNPVFNNIYAFDLSPTAIVTDYTTMSGITPKLMWVIEGGTGDYKLLGQTWSRPQVGTMTVYNSGTKSGDYTTKDVLALFFGGGNSTTSEGNVVTPTGGVAGNAVFIANASTGARMFWASDPAETDSSGDGPDLPLADMDYPITSDLTMLDINADGGIDRLYFGDLGGQVWRIDLGTDFDPAGTTPANRLGANGFTNGYVFADLNCPRNTDKTRNCPATAIDQNWRRLYYRPDVGAVRDGIYVSSGTSDYDLITFGTGDRSDPLDKLTSGVPEEPVHNRVYAMRDYDISYGPPSTIPMPINGVDDTELYDATTNDIGSATQSTVDAAKLKLTTSKGWFVDLRELTQPAWTSTDTIGARFWIGEKSLARTVILAGVVYATTFTPANADTATSTCSPNEGEATVYAFNALDADLVVDMDGDGTLDRSLKVGGGIPSELVTVIREDGTVGLVGASGGGQKINVNNEGSLKRTYWTEE